MEKFIRESGIACVIDATHPYACLLYTSLHAAEIDAEAAALVRANAEKFRLHNVTVHEGSALAVMEHLPDPDGVFIGGSGPELDVYKRQHRQHRRARRGKEARRGIEKRR